MGVEDADSVLLELTDEEEGLHCYPLEKKPNALEAVEAEAAYTEVHVEGGGIDLSEWMDRVEGRQKCSLEYEPHVLEADAACAEVVGGDIGLSESTDESEGHQQY